MILIVLSLLMVSGQGQTDAYCQVLKPDLNETAIYNAYGLYEQYFLGDLFEGFNLTFDAYVNDNVDLKIDAVTFEVDSSLELLSRIDFQEVVKYQDVAVYKETNGDINYAELIDATKKGQTTFNYMVRYGKSFSHSSPLPISIQVDLDYDSNQRCFQLTFIKETTVMVDCYSRENGTQKLTDIFYIIDFSDPETTSNLTKQQFSSYGYEQDLVYSRELRTFINDIGHTMVAQATLASGLSDDKLNTYINIFRYFDDPSKEQPQGYVDRFKELNNETFGWKSLKTVDIEVLDGAFYILDQYNGIATFRIDRNGITEIKYISLDQYGIREAFGMAVDLDGGYLLFTVLSQDLMYVFRTFSVDDELELIELYELEINLAATPEVHVSPKHIVYRVAQQAYVIQRERFDNSKIYSYLTSLNYFHLFDSEHLWVWRNKSLSILILQEPTVEIMQNNILQGGETVEIVIKATSNYYQTKKECVLVFYSSGFMRDDTDAFFTNYREDEFKVHVEEGWQIFPIDREWVGPDIAYHIDMNQTRGGLDGDYVNEENPIIIFEVPEQIEIDLEDTQQTDFIFSAVLGFAEIVQIHVYQLANYTFLVYNCYDYVDYIFYQSCVLKNSHNLDSQIKEFSDGLWGGEMAFVFVTEKTPNLLRFYDYSGDELSFEDPTWDSEQANITSIVLQNNMLIIVDQGTRKSVEIFQQTPERFKLVESIDQQYVANWYQLIDYESNSTAQVAWEPVAVSSHYHHVNTIAVQLASGHAVLISLEDNPSYLGHVNLTKNCSKTGNLLCHIALISDGLLVIRSDEVIKRYGIQDFTKPDYLFDFPSYGYNFVEEKDQFVHYAVSNNSGYVYVLAEEPNTKDLRVLVYRSNQEYIRTLYRAISINQPFDNKSSISLSADGQFGVDYAFLSVNGQVFSFRVPYQESIRIKANSLFPETQYSNYFSFPYEVISMNGQEYSMLLEVLFINDQTEIYINNQTLSEIGFYEGIKPPGDYYPSRLYLNRVSRYFHGPVLGLQLVCDHCAYESQPNLPVDFINRIQKSKVQLKTKGLDKVVSSFQNPITKIVYLIQDTTVQAYVPVNGDLQLRGIVSTVNPICQGQTECYQLLPSYSKDNTQLDYIFSICECDDLWYASAIGFENDEETELKFIKNLVIDKVSNHQFSQAQIFEQRLFILHSANNSLLNSIQIYNIVQDVETADVILSKRVKTIDNVYLDLAEAAKDYLRISSFEVSTTHSPGRFLLFLTNETQNFYAVEINSTTLLIITPTDFREKDGRFKFFFYNQLMDEKQYISPDTKLQYIEVVDQYDEDNNYVYQVLVFTENLPIFLYEIVFTKPNPTKLKSPMTLQDDCCDVKAAFSQYGKSKIQRYISWIDNYFAVAYYSEEKDIYTLVVYSDDYGLIGSRQRTSNNQVQFIQLAGGIDFENVVPQLGDYTFFGFSLYKDENDNLRGFFPDPNIKREPILFDINNSTYIEFKNGNFPKETLTLNIISSQTAPDYQVSIDGVIQPFKINPNSSSSSDGWIIAVSVVGGVLFLAIAGYFGWKYYKSKKTEGENQDGLSLQEPIRA